MKLLITILWNYLNSLQKQYRNGMEIRNQEYANITVAVDTPSGAVITVTKYRAGESCDTLQKYTLKR